MRMDEARDDPHYAESFGMKPEFPNSLLEACIGSSRCVAEVLNRKRPLSLKMVKSLHKGLQIPYESLLADW
jgi:HTH-type transcriptional regulator/antitoxin HigA